MIKKFLNIAICLVLLASTEVRAQQDTCRVALMVPLYLEQVDQEFWNAEPSNKMLSTKPFSFLHFYEGFMIAADSITSSRNMKLELKVYDVDNTVSKADSAILDPWLATVDLIVGPFYLKPFNVLKQFAFDNNIPIVNPITQHSDIVDNQPNMIKVKPSMKSQLVQLDSLIRRQYHDNNVFIIRQDRYTDTAMVNRIKQIAERNIDSCTYVDNQSIVNTIRKHQKRWDYLNIKYEATEYLTDSVILNVDSLGRCIDDTTVFLNRVISVNYKRDSLHTVMDYASTMRNNLIIVYGTDKVLRLAERQYATDGSDQLKRQLVMALIDAGEIDGYKRVGAGCGDNRAFVDNNGNPLESTDLWISCSLERGDTLCLIHSECRSEK